MESDIHRLFKCHLSPRTLWSALLAVLAAAFVVTVWPTAYRYDKVQIGQRTLPMRVNRLTGDTEVFFGTRWVREKPSAQSVALISLPKDQVSLIELDAHLNRFLETVSGKIYNGSDYVVREVIVHLSVSRTSILIPLEDLLDSSSSSSQKANKRIRFNDVPQQVILWSRKIKISDLYIPPLTVGEFSTKITRAEENTEVNATILSVLGHKEH